MLGLGADRRAVRCLYVFIVVGEEVHQILVPYTILATPHKDLWSHVYGA